MAIKVPDEWHAVMWHRASCPECKDFEVFGPAQRIIAIHLNDKHRWTRERIAAWVEEIELQVLGPVAIVEAPALEAHPSH